MLSGLNLDSIIEKLSFAERPGQDGDFASYIINLQMKYLPSSMIIISLVAILAAILKLPSNDPNFTSEKVCPGSTVSRKQYEEVVNGLLHEISFQPPDFEFDMGLKGRVENSLESHGISREFISKIGQCINTATKITSFTYPFVSHEVREAIALYASYVITIDDLTTKILPDLKKYTTQLVLGQSHQHELLRGFTRFLGGQQQLFRQFGGDMIVKGSIEFISAAVVEQNQDKCLHLSSDASDYLVFFRGKTGVAEPFAFFCFPENSNPEDQDLARYVAAIPSIMLFLGYVNDLLSFYKEECNAEDCPGFIQNHSKVHGFTLLQSLHQLRKETIEEVRKVRSILSHDTVMTERINRFIYGYIFYHLCSGRYRLHELNIPAAVDARTHFQEMAKV